MEEEAPREGERLPPSKLGTKEHWDDHYTREVTNFEEFGDEGLVWFGDGSKTRMAAWVERYFEDRLDAAMVDLGCGNGHLVFELLERGFTNVRGVDYSPAAVTLAQALAAKHDVDPDLFAVADILDPAYAAAHRHAFDLVLDKGTYDAISLSPAAEDRVRFVHALEALLRPGTGLFLITSCNWTQAELTAHFADGFEYHSHVKQPTFSFGGQTGQTTVTVAFRRRDTDDAVQA